MNTHQAIPTHDLPLFCAGKGKMERQFEIFDAANPKVWEWFKQFAFQALEAGRKHLSADEICHRIRWEANVETKGGGYNPDTGGELKINNNYTAYHARKFMRDFPKYQGVFRTRTVNRKG